MNSFLFWGLMSGGICVALYCWLAASIKTPPVLGHAIELIIVAVGAAGGFKICGYVLSGQLVTAFRLALASKQHGSVVSVSEDDVLYFLIGGFALIWVSFEGIVRSLWPLYRQRQVRAAPPVPAPVPVGTIAQSSVKANQP
jgi:hypothetical protein